MEATEPLPLPVEDNSSSLEERRLWIGNLDPRVTEFQLVKILQKHGSFEKFDLLYHKAGPQAGLPRGYAFVTFKDKASAESFKLDYDGRRVGDKVMSVKYAHVVDKETLDKKVELVIPALGPSSVKEDKRPMSRESQIRAIETKLKMMAQFPDKDFKVNNAPSTGPAIVSTAPKRLTTNPIQKRSTYRTSYRDSRRNKPYHRK